MAFKIWWSYFVYGFSLNQSDKCVYNRFDSSGSGVIICLYVDDMLIFGTDQNQINATKNLLSSEFSIRYGGGGDNHWNKD